MMRRPAGFDADPRRRQLLEELDKRPSPQLLPQHRLLGRIYTMQLKNTLGRVHSNTDKIVHGRPPCLRSATTSFWHIDAVGGRPPQQPRARVIRHAVAQACFNTDIWDYGSRPSPRLRRDDKWRGTRLKSSQAPACRFRESSRLQPARWDPVCA